MTLPSLQLRVAALRWLFGWPIRQVAVFLGVTPGTVKTELFRARASLRKHLIDPSGWEPIALNGSSAVVLSAKGAADRHCEATPPCNSHERNWTL